ncbi:hypothetical protein BKA63DRAFT_561545 [Paraphoma chrysanthemicola]|nr:hypothetical protein BKA63DRAFT_561545 [Paraphoma chrysanthemicola]
MAEDASSSSTSPGRSAPTSPALPCLFEMSPKELETLLYEDGRAADTHHNIVAQPSPNTRLDHRPEILEHDLTKNDLNASTMLQKKDQNNQTSHQLNRCDTVDPWAVEFEPNPVIFAHLFDCFSTDDDVLVPEATENVNPEPPIFPGTVVLGALDVSKQCRDPRINTISKVCSATNERGVRCAWTMDLLEPICPTHGSTFQHFAVVRESNDELLPNQNAPIPPSTTINMAVKPQKTLTQKSRLINRPSESSERQEQLTGTISSCPSDPPSTPSYPDNSSAQCSSRSELRLSALAFAAVGRKFEIACTYCELTFPTQGKVNEHVNRKHIRRFVCNTSGCDTRFHLQADLNRHTRTVHDQTNSDTETLDDKTPSWSCPLEHCATPSKVWPRKDNFNRHVERCQKAVPALRDDFKDAETNVKDGSEANDMVQRQHPVGLTRGLSLFRSRRQRSRARRVQCVATEFERVVPRSSF